jgi:tRNA (cmo5U34)-methyltransferase
MGPETSFEKHMSMRIAGYYDLREAVLRSISDNISDPADWLDCGCGSGGSVRLSVERFPDTRFVLADPSADNLGQAREVYGDGRFSYAVGTTDSLDIEDGSFDVITAVLSHHYYINIEARAAAVANCFRMLRPGGMFLTVEHILHPGSQAEADAQWESYMRGQGLPEESIREMFDRRGTVYHPLTVEQHVRILEDAGFRDVRKFWDSCSDAGLFGFKPA